MYKIYQKLLFTLLLALISGLVSACEYCNNNKEDLTLACTPNHQSIKESDKNDRKVPLPPPAGQEQPSIFDQALKKEVVVNQKQELKEQELKEQELKEQELKEQELKEQELKEQELKEQELKEQQKKIKEELINTEASYNKSIKLVNDFFLAPLLQEERFKNKKKIKDFAQEVQNLLNPLITLSDSLQKDLTEKNSTGITNQAIREIFNKHISSFSSFAPFIASYKDVLKKYSDLLLKKNEILQNFLTEQKKKPELNLLGFEDLLIMPIQRAPRYEIIIKDLLKKIPAEDPEHKGVQEVLNQLEQVLDLLNAAGPKNKTRFPKNKIPLSEKKKSHTLPLLSPEKIRKNISRRPSV